MVITSENTAQTMKIAEDLAAVSKRGDVYCLKGGLGVGKTVFAKGFAIGLGIKQDVTSPTFNLVYEYRGRMPFYHFDVYRINSISEMEYTGYEEYFYGDGVCLIEWAELISPLIPSNAVWITIEKDPAGENIRRIEISGG